MHEVELLSKSGHRRKSLLALFTRQKPRRSGSVASVIPCSSHSVPTKHGRHTASSRSAPPSTLARSSKKPSAHTHAAAEVDAFGDLAFSLQGRHAPWLSAISVGR